MCAYHVHNIAHIPPERRGPDASARRFMGDRRQQRCKFWTVIRNLDIVLSNAVCRSQPVGGWDLNAIRGSSTYGAGEGAFFRFRWRIGYWLRCSAAPRSDKYAINNTFSMRNRPTTSHTHCLNWAICPRHPQRMSHHIHHQHTHTHTPTHIEYSNACGHPQHDE